jgi:hypothetical protein
MGLDSHSRNCQKTSQFWEMEPGEVVHTPGKLKLEEEVHILAWKEVGTVYYQQKSLSGWGDTGRPLTASWQKRRVFPCIKFPTEKGLWEAQKGHQSAERDAEEANQINKYPAMRAVETQISVPELRVVSEQTI